VRIIHANFTFSFLLWPKVGMHVMEEWILYLWLYHTFLRLDTWESVVVMFSVTWRLWLNFWVQRMH